MMTWPGLRRGGIGVLWGALSLGFWGCAGTAVKPAARQATTPPAVQAIDIGQCYAYRYSSDDHCAEHNQADCQNAVSDGDCGIPYNFVYTNSYCSVNTSTFYEYHVICQGYLNTGPIPQPQCPDGHVFGTWGQDCAGSCTEHCADYCTGGYCTGGAYNLCYLQYAPECDCGTYSCPQTGPPGLR